MFTILSYYCYLIGIYQLYFVETYAKLFVYGKLSIYTHFPYSISGHNTFSRWKPFNLFLRLFLSFSLLLFSTHGRAPPISWHMCSIVRDLCLSLPTTRRLLGKQRTLSLFTKRTTLRRQVARAR